MSGSMNKVLLVGNLGKDPELKMTPSGQAVARFSVATTETWKNQAGEKQSKTEWHNCQVWGKLAEIAEKYLRKGKQVLVEGRIQYREYTDQQGVKKNFTEIRVDNFVMLGKMDESDRQQNGGRQSYDNAPASTPTGGDGGGYDDDIPF